MKKKQAVLCTHVIADHIGHGLLYETCSAMALKAECCGGVELFNYCPYCGKEVRDIIEKITKK